MAEARPHTGVYVSGLTLTDFRCYKSTRLAVTGTHPMVVLVGPNGAGKTNVLEALSYLAPGRGLRGAALGDVKRQQASTNGATQWAVAARVNIAGEEIQVGTGLEGTEGDASGRRLVRIDGESLSSTNALGERWSVTWLTPQMDRLFIEAPSGRRKFLDRLVLALTPDHSRQIGAYERAMRERNRLLADGYRGDLDPWLNALEMQLSEHGVAIAAARLDAVAALHRHIDTAPADGFPVPLISLDGSLEAALEAGEAASDVEHAYRERLAQARPYDSGRLGEGVHRTDLLVEYGEKAMPAPQCSTGEQKALLVHIILAHAQVIAARRGTPPLLLLDELAAHLDEGRRDRLLARLARSGSQVWLTGTDDRVFDTVGIHANRFRIGAEHAVTRLD